MSSGAGTGASTSQASRCLLTVHAHPDDESEFGGPTVARYHDEGVRTVLVCCTDGGSGRILNPEVGTVGDRTNIATIRRHELEQAAAIIGYDAVVMLGYPDSGSVNLPEPERSPTCFARLALDGPVWRVVEVIRRERPQVVVTYADDQAVYPHPDHWRAHQVATRAFALAARADAFPEAGSPWRPAKLYYHVTSRERRRLINEQYLALNLDAPFTAQEGAGLQGRGDPELAPPEARVTTRVDVGAYTRQWVRAMRAHRSQLKPALARTLSIPAEALPGVFGSDEYILALDLTGRPEGARGEVDLFDGLG